MIASVRIRGAPPVSLICRHKNALRKNKLFLTVTSNTRKLDWICRLRPELRILTRCEPVEVPPRFVDSQITEWVWTASRLGNAGSTLPTPARALIPILHLYPPAELK